MKKLIAILLTLVCLVDSQTSLAAESDKGSFDVKETIFEHLEDHYGWELPFTTDRRIPLPVILWSKTSGWHLFSSSRVTGGQEYQGFRIATSGDYKNKIVEAVGGSYVRPVDLSVTKNVAALIVAALVDVAVVLNVRKWYTRNRMKAPRKFTAGTEALVEFIYSDVIKPTLGDKATRFAPYLLTVFFFIFTMNLLGLVVIFPGGANLTGNLAVTMVLAVATFGITNVCGTKHYWKDILWPDVPLWLKFPIPIMPVIEVFGIFTKPVTLMIRLFANMMAGHMIVLVLTCLIFIFASYGIVAQCGATAVSVLFGFCMLMLDVLFSFIQAFVFTILSTIFIGLALEKGEAKEQ